MIELLIGLFGICLSVATGARLVDTDASGNTPDEVILRFFFELITGLVFVVYGICSLIVGHS